MKHYFDIPIRLRKDSGATEPEYTSNEVLQALVDGRAKFQKNDNGTVFILDAQKTNKVMAVIEVRCQCADRADQYHDKHGVWICADCELPIKSNGKMSEEEFISSVRRYAATLNRPLEDQDVVDVYGVDYDEAKRVINLLK